MLVEVANAHERGLQVRLDLNVRELFSSIEFAVMDTREIGAAWLDLLYGKDSPFERFVRRVKVYAPKYRMAIGWEKTRLRILERDGYKCTYCGATEHLQCDHILARVRGGGDEDQNLTAACRSCNASKKDRLVEEWRRG